MPASTKPSTYHLRAFVLCLAVILVALVCVLFGVRMEALSHGSGIVKMQGTIDLRAPHGGVAELGWYEGEVLCSGNLVKVRVDRDGNGMSDPAKGTRRIERFACPEGSTLSLDQLRFVPLQNGARLWPGQVIASVRAPDLWQQLARLSSPAVLAPTGHAAYLALKVRCEPGQAVSPGDVLATLAPVDAATGQPLGWIAQVDVPEKNAAWLEAGQEARLISAMYNQRLHGHAEGVVDKVEPTAEPAENGERRFQAQIKINSSPFPLHHGMSVKAEIVLGHKRVCRIILEH